MNRNQSLEKLRVAQVGVANYGGYRRLSMRATGLFDLRAVYDRDVAAMNAAAAEEGAAIVASYEELLETPEIEAVIISTGALYHAEQIEKAARRGLHVFVEKPVCATADEVQRLLALERETGVVIATGHIAHEVNPLSLQIRGMLESGELGTIATFQKTTAHSGGLTIRPGDWRGDPARNPGGMLFQCGVHGLHELMFYFGPIAEVYAAMRSDVHTTQTADVAHCTLTFESGLIGVLSAYHVTPYKHTLQIFGTRANLYREERFFDEGTSLHIQRSLADGKQEPLEAVALPQEKGDHGNLRRFYAAIREGAANDSFFAGLRAVQVVFASEESFRLRRPVAVAPLATPCG